MRAYWDGPRRGRSVGLVRGLAGWSLASRPKASRSNRRLHGIGGLPDEVDGGSAVGVQRQGDGAVAEHLHHDARTDALRHEEVANPVAEVMQANRRKIGSGERPAEPPKHVARVQRKPGLGDEHEGIVGPPCAMGQSLLSLPQPMRPECRDDVTRERNRPDRRLRLRRHEHELAAHTL